ncbi:aminotransferase class IV [Zeaxanthinibacter enoshimensis]|uniref:branched-chain-amino-acid transaminase n=1 Tax=Zeaxanthinibacter enoshimensis TaxID=392009 RepID=A0A4R6TKM2_9FLAO|nr:aminotransferase class IV [Zeaxanthinibacter enoshimensis]TDQ31217.1 branched-chain amino acid aminotransferase [Zeaxanthinibacter enoshimensis]
MFNFDGQLHPEESKILTHTNRGLRYGDALFETMRAVNGKLYFWEDHYLRLMASMRMLRMEIPMSFTMEFLEEEIQKTLRSKDLDKAPARVRLTVFRKDGGRYLPDNNDTSFLVEAETLEQPFYVLPGGDYEIELFKDYTLNADPLSTLKTANKLLNVVGSVFASENGYDNCLIINQHKHIVEALNGNLFVVHGNTIKTAPLEDGCLNGIIRKKLIELIGKLEDYELEESAVSPFELQKADELFITNSIMGIRPVTKYRKAEYGNKVAADLIGKLNAVARLG